MTSLYICKLLLLNLQNGRTSKIVTSYHKKFTSNAYWLQSACLFLGTTDSAQLFYSNESVSLLGQFIPFNWGTTYKRHGQK